MGKKMKQHRFVARIDNNLWNDFTRVIKLQRSTTSINAAVNEGMSLYRDVLLERITKQRKRRETLRNI